MIASKSDSITEENRLKTQRWFVKDLNRHKARNISRNQNIILCRLISESGCVCVWGGGVCCITCVRQTEGERLKMCPEVPI